MMVRTTLSMHWCFVMGQVPPLQILTCCSTLFLVLSSLLLALNILYLLDGYLLDGCGCGYGNLWIA